VATHSSVHLALVRGINVGGKHMIPMAALAGIVTECGCSDVRTYIQSGNVVFGAAPSVARRVPRLAAEKIEERFGFKPLVLIRTGDEVARVAADNPFLSADPDGKALFVGFLAEVPDPRLVATLDPNRSPGDSCAVRGREVYLHLRNGVLKTKLTGPFLDSALSTTSTTRNWRTVMKLAELTGQSR